MDLDRLYKKPQRFLLIEVMSPSGDIATYRLPDTPNSRRFLAEEWGLNGEAEAELPDGRFVAVSPAMVGEGL